MTGLPTIYVDFNNRVRPLATNGEFFRVGLDDIAGLDLHGRVIATDYDELEFEAIVVARRLDLGYGEIQIIRMPSPVGSLRLSPSEGGFGEWGSFDLDMSDATIGPQEVIHS